MRFYAHKTTEYINIKMREQKTYCLLVVCMANAEIKKLGLGNLLANI